MYQTCLSIGVPKSYSIIVSFPGVPNWSQQIRFITHLRRSDEFPRRPKSPGLGALPSFEKLLCGLKEGLKQRKHHFGGSSEEGKPSMRLPILEAEPFNQALRQFMRMH